MKKFAKIALYSLLGMIVLTRLGTTGLDRSIDKR